MKAINNKKHISLLLIAAMLISIFASNDADEHRCRHLCQQR